MATSVEINRVPLTAGTQEHGLCEQMKHHIWESIPVSCCIMTSTVRIHPGYRSIILRWGQNNYVRKKYYISAKRKGKSRNSKESIHGSCHNGISGIYLSAASACNCYSWWGSGGTAASVNVVCTGDNMAYASLPVSNWKKAQEYPNERKQLEPFSVWRCEIIK